MGTLSGTGPMHMKRSRARETDLADVGQRFDVLTRISRVPPKESYATPDDGFNEKDTSNRVDFAHPGTRKEFVHPPDKAKFIVKETVPEVCYEERRPIPGNTRGFGAVLNRHTEGHDRRFFNTTHGDSYGYQPGGRTATCLDPSAMTHRGLSTREMDTKVASRRVGRLCGEDFRESDNPARDTRTQRTWLYHPDASLRHIDVERPALPKEDNELSLPLGDGHMSKIRAAMEERRGLLHRTGTEITKTAAKMNGIKIFLDD